MAPPIQISNRSEFQKVYLKFFNGLSNYAYSILKDKDSAQDVVQEVFLDLWQKRKSLQLKTSLDAYLLRSVKFKSIDFIRKQSTKQQYVASVTAQTQVHHEAETEHEEADAAKKERISFAIAQLPQKCREAFLLSRQDGLTYKEIAKHMNISVKTVENQLSKALKLLRNLLSDLRVLILFFCFCF